MKKPNNLADAIQKELKRAREILEMYKQIPTGFFGASMIEVIIKKTEKAILDGNVVEELRCYKELKSIE